MIDDSKFNDNQKPPRGRKPFQFDRKLRKATEAVRKVILEEEKYCKE